MNPTKEGGKQTIAIRYEMVWECFQKYKNVMGWANNGSINPYWSSTSVKYYVSYPEQDYTLVRVASFMFQ